MTILGGICGKCKKYYRGSWCPECEKIDVDRTLNFIADFHDEYYDHGLGQVIKSRQHRKRVMKEKGLFEIGNEWKYVDPERNREISERKLEKNLKDINIEALRRIGG